MALRRRAGFVLVLVSLASCSSSSNSGSSTTGGSSPAAAAFPAQFADRWCSKLAACCVASGGTTLDTCRAETAQKADDDRTAAEATGATFDSAAASTCLQFIEAATCDPDVVGVRDLLAKCDVWLGIVPSGGPCTRAAQCDDRNGNAVLCANSKCVASTISPVGGPCTMSSDCDSFVAACDATLHACTALPTAGQPCSQDCRGNLDCGADGTCHARAALGANCTKDLDCASDVCSNAGTCVSIWAGEHCTLP